MLPVTIDEMKLVWLPQGFTKDYTLSVEEPDTLGSVADMMV